MNLTVGPLPPAVYWRRRAIVLGALLLVILLIAYSCGGSGTSNASSQQQPPVPAASDTEFSMAPPSSAPSAPVSPAPSTPPSTPPPSDSAPPSPSASTAAGIATCADDQIRVTPVITSTSSTTTRLELGGTYDLKLKVRNVSDTTCRRDVGSVPEELLVTRGSTKIWSSDDCQQPKGRTHDIRTFGPGIEIYAEVMWNSYLDNTGTTCKKSSKPAPAGKYSLTGRVGTAKTTISFKIG